MKLLNNRYEDVNTQGISPLQAEKGEVISTPQGYIVDSAATKKHSKMDATEATDYLPSGSYIFSNDPQMTLSKKELEELIYGKSLAYYEEGEKSKAPKDLKFGKFISGKESTPAKVAKNIEKAYPVFTDNAHKYNPFITRANRLNMNTRSKPMMILQMLNDEKKEEVQLNNDIAQFYSEESNPEASQMQQSTMQPIDNSANTEVEGLNTYQWGGTVGGAASGAAAGSVFGPVGAGVGALVGGVGSYFTGKSKKKKAEQDELERNALFKELYGLNTNSYAANNAATIAKSAIPLPRYSNLDLSSPMNRTQSMYSGILGSRDSRSSAALANAQSYGNSLARSMSTSGLNPAQASNLAGNATAQGINSMNNASMNLDQYYDNLKQQMMGQLNQYDMMTAQDKQRGENATSQQRYSRNLNTVGELGNNYQGYNAKESQLKVDDYSSKLAGQLAAAREQNDAQAMFNNSLITGGRGVQSGLGMYDYLKNPFSADSQSQAVGNGAASRMGFQGSGQQPGGYKHRYNPASNSVEISYDHGITWMPI